MYEEKPVVFIEGLVYNGEVKKIWIEGCEGAFARVCVETIDGKRFSTRCLHKDAARKLASVWNIYVSKGWSVYEKQPG